MIQFNCEFDSKDAVSSKLYHWLSLFPLDINRLKITTSFDYIDPNSNQTHNLGKIVMEAASKGNLQSTFDVNKSVNALNKLQFNSKPDVPAFSNHLESLPKEQSLNPTYSKGANQESVNTAFDSDLDDSLLLEVAFEKDDYADLESKIFKPTSQKLQQTKVFSDPIVTERLKPLPVSVEENNFEDFDFLLNSLDEFNT